MGAIQWVDLDPECSAEDGFLDLAEAGTIAIGGLDAYHTAHRVARLSYAKVTVRWNRARISVDGWD